LYRLRTGAFEGGLHAIAFVDAGRAWSDPRHRWSLDEQRIAVDGGVGLGASEDKLRIYFAHGLQRGDASWVISMRLRRPSYAPRAPPAPPPRVPPGARRGVGRAAGGGARGAAGGTGDRDRARVPARARRPAAGGRASRRRVLDAHRREPGARHARHAPAP